MKKALLFTLAALCVSAAQAVTVNWTYSGSEVYTETQDKFIKTTNSFETGYSLALVLSINSLPAADAQIMHIAQWASGNSKLILGADGKLKFQENANGGSGSAEMDVSIGDTISVVFTWAYGENANSETQPLISHYANGVSKVSVQQNTKAPGLQMGSKNADGSVANEAVSQHKAWTVEEITAYTGILTEKEMELLTTHKTSNITTVPEPTALALLTLGVAGLALKRKVA